MWYEFFVFGGLWFWGLALLEIIVLFVCVANEIFSKAAISIGVFLLILCLFGNKGTFHNSITYIKENPQDCLRWVFIYAIIGVIWAMLKMLLSTNKVKQQIVKAKEKYVVYLNSFESGKTKSIIDTPGWNYRKTETLPKSWEDYVHDALGYKSSEKLNFGTYRDRIIYWGCYWPVSFIWTFLDDLFIQLAKWVYDNILVGVFRYIHTKTIGNALKFESPIVDINTTSKKE
jgi:hypothetical protein